MSAAMGPFSSEREVSELPGVRAVYEVFDRDPGAGKMAPHIRRLLGETLAAAGVELGAYDRRILAGLTVYETTTVAVVAGWVQRAYLAGKADGYGRNDEDDAPGLLAVDADLISLVAATAHEIANEHDRDCGDGKCTCTGGDPRYWENVTGTVLAAAAFHARVVPLTAGDQADEPGMGGAR